MRLATALVIASFAAATPGATIYKSIGPDGRVVYSDKPPPAGTVKKTFNFSGLPASPLPDALIRYREQLEKSLKNRLAAAKQPSGSAAEPTLFTAKWCGHCRTAKAYLTERKIHYMERDIDTKTGMEAYVQAGGEQGVPLLVWRGQKVLGFTAAAYDALLSAR